jgi:hypothetical protein
MNPKTLVISVGSIFLLLGILIILTWRESNTPEAKAATAAYEARQKAETLLVHPSKTVKVTVVTEPEDFSIDGRVYVMRGRTSDGTVSMVFVYHPHDPMLSCFDRLRKGEIIDVEQKFFRATNDWQAPVNYDGQPHFVLWTTPKCR